MIVVYSVHHVKRQTIKMLSSIRRTRGPFGMAQRWESLIDALTEHVGGHRISPVLHPLSLL